MMQEHTYEYVIGGAGSAGCVLARRLSDAGHRVLLIESGPSDKSWVISMPAGLRSVFKPSSKYNYWFKTVDQLNLNNRSIAQPRGRVLGGSSSINGMTWLRGHPLDYDGWAASGAKGWGWADCLPYFKKSERSELDSPYRGVEGLINAQRKGSLSDLNRAFLAAGIEAGFPMTEDVNGFKQEGVSRFEMSVDRGVRNSTSYGYLRDASSKLDVWTGCTILKINFVNNIAAGFQVRRDGMLIDVIATRETLLCAGVFGSPQLLMLSGIGQSEQLAKLQIQTIADLDGVGENLQDHLECHIQIETKKPVSLNAELHYHRMLLTGLNWFLLRKGPASVNQCHVGAFLKSSTEVKHPDIQFHFFPVFFDKEWIPTRHTYGYRIGVGPMRPTSRGTVRLRTSSVDDPLVIDPRYMSTDADWTVMRESMRLGLLFARQKAFAPFQYRIDSPLNDLNDNSSMDEFIREDASSAYHPCGTCRMGDINDPSTVVDPQLKVKGVHQLRIIDASVMPAVPSANINAATIMIAEKASDMILEKKLLAPQALPFA